MMGVRFTGHPELKRILMWEGFAYYPLRKDFLEPYYEGPDQGLRQPGRGGLRPALPGRGDQPPRHQHEGPQGLQGLGEPLEQRDDPKGKHAPARRGRGRASWTPTSSSSAWARSTRARTASSG